MAKLAFNDKAQQYYNVPTARDFWKLYIIAAVIVAPFLYMWLAGNGVLSDITKVYCITTVDVDIDAGAKAVF